MAKVAGTYKDAAFRFTDAAGATVAELPATKADDNTYYYGDNELLRSAYCNSLLCFTALFCSIKAIMPSFAIIKICFYITKGIFNCHKEILCAIMRLGQK